MGKFILVIGILISLQVSYAQNRNITGRVTDQSGNPMESVSVLASKNNTGTKTDKNGYYSFSFPANTQAIIFSFVGYQTEKRIPGDISILNVQMKLEENRLKDVIVTATGIEKRRNKLGYSVGALSNEDLTMGRSSNLANALTAKIPGVRVTGTNGMAGSSASVFIRGLNTITGSNQPLFVVDGIPIDNGGGTNALNSGVTNSNRALDLNQDDIQSISVLKGPAAGVLYGSRAASGAIIITTKKGRVRTKNTIQFNSTTQFVNINRYPQYQNEYAQGASSNPNPLTLNSGQYALFNPNSPSSWGPAINGQTVKNFLGNDETLQAHPDNVKDIFRQGINLQNNISMSGGGEKTSYRLSIGNLYETGVLKNNELVKTNISFNGSTNITSKLTSGINFQYINSNSKRVQQGNQASNPFFSGWYLPRSYNLHAYPYKNPDESQVYFDPGSDNPLWTLEKNLWNDYVNRIIGNVNFKYDVSDFMNITYKLGGDFYNQYISAFDEIGAKGQANTNSGGRGGVLESNSNFMNYYSYLNLNFSHTFFENIHANFVLGNELVWRGNRYTQSIGRGLSVAGFRNLSNAAAYYPSNAVTKQFLAGLYGDLALDYKGIVTLNLTGRNDWSSTFGVDKRSYFYPAIAGSVDITEAIPSLRNNSFINFVKVFANYATVGKEADPYATNAYFVTGGAIDNSGLTISFPFNGITAFTYSNSIGDPKLGPEFTSSSELGTELSLWQGRIRLEAAWYNSKSKDIIFPALSPSSSGIERYIINSGELETKGWEFLLQVTPVKNKSFSWTTSFNFTRYKTMCTRLADGVNVLPLGGIFSTNARMQAGSPYGVLYGSVLRRNSKGELWLNDRGQTVVANAIAQIGDPNPDWLLGITNEFDFKGFHLNFLLDIRVGGDVYSRNTGDLLRTGTAKKTTEYPRYTADGKTPNRPYEIQGVGPDSVTASHVPLTAEQYFGNLYASGVGETYVFDASWIRLRELNLGYSFPSSLFKKSFLGGMEIGVVGRNLFLYAPHFSNFDPENNVYGVSNVQGLEFNGLPSTRSVGFYLKLNL